MSSSQNGNNNNSMPYRPTSLDFINRPNPVEPHAVPEKHPLNGGPRLEETAKQEFLRLLLDKNVERPAKRRKSGESKTLDLPMLPAVKNVATKRLRIPPTLSGLHQPPPDAGLLPSMSVEQPMSFSNAKSVASTSEPETKDTPPSNSEVAKSKEGATPKSKDWTSKRKHNKWTEEETADLLKGAARFGIGNWTKILNCPDYHFENRSALDLKDRFRTCCPDEYKMGRTKNGGNVHVGEAINSAQEKTPSSIPKTEQVSSSQLEKFGIDGTFEKSKRRQRTDYTDAQDEALLRGFRKHKNSWAAIQREEELFKDRTATDLRDRFRTRYPDEYAKAGLAPRPEQFPKRAERKEQTTSSKAPKLPQKPTEKENKEPASAPPSKKQPPTSLLHTADVFWGAPFEPDESEAAEQVTLDRRILDWPHDITREQPPVSTDNAITRGTGIDPLATLKLPRPIPSVGYGGGSGPASSSTNAVPSSVNSLPSLATITAGPSMTSADEDTSQLELPSLMGALGALESDGRTSGGFISMEDLLS